VHLLNPSTLNQQIADGDADLAITTPDSSQPHLRMRHLFEETYVPISRRGHPRLNA
jgi:DNA-binding transcriptional LysR family regulator